MLGSTYLIEVWKVIAITWLLQMVFIVSSVAFALLLSTLFKNTVTSLGISAIAVAIFSLLTFFMPFPFMKNIYPLVFTTYSSGLDILTGNLNMNLGNSSISITFGIVTMMVWATFSFVASFKIFITEDVLT